jgi:hypothetical protein
MLCVSSLFVIVSSEQTIAAVEDIMPLLSFLLLLFLLRREIDLLLLLAIASSQRFRFDMMIRYRTFCRFCLCFLPSTTAQSIPYVPAVVFDLWEEEDAGNKSPVIAIHCIRQHACVESPGLKARI